MWQIPMRCVSRSASKEKEPFIANTSTSIRNVARLIADVTDFMTLAPGDVLTLGVPHGAPVAHVGDEISIAIGDWPPLCFSMTAKKETDDDARPCCLRRRDS